MRKVFCCCCSSGTPLNKLASTPNLDPLMCPIRQYQCTFLSCALQPDWILFSLQFCKISRCFSKETLFLVKYQQLWRSLDYYKQLHLEDKPNSSSLFTLLFGCCLLALEWKQKTSSAFNKRPVFLAFLSSLENTRCTWGSGRSNSVLGWLVIGKQWKGFWKPSSSKNPKQSLCVLNCKAKLISYQIQ